MKGRRPNATCPWTKHKASKCKVMPEEWGVSKLAPAQVEGRGGALFQECLAQKVIPGVKIYENFIKHLFVPWYSPDSREKKKKRGQAFWKTKGAWSMDFSFWETHLKIHLKEPKVHTLLYLQYTSILFPHWSFCWQERLTCFSYWHYPAHLSFTIWCSFSVENHTFQRAPFHLRRGYLLIACS